MTNITLSN